MTSRHDSGVFLPEGSRVNGMRTRFFFLKLSEPSSVPGGTCPLRVTLRISATGVPLETQNFDYPTVIISPPTYAASPACPHSWPNSGHGCRPRLRTTGPGDVAGTVTAAQCFLLLREAACFGATSFLTPSGSSPRQSWKSKASTHLSDPTAKNSL